MQYLFVSNCIRVCLCWRKNLTRGYQAWNFNFETKLFFCCFFCLWAKPSLESSGQKAGASSRLEQFGTLCYTTTLSYTTGSLRGCCAHSPFWQEISSTKVNCTFGPARSFSIWSSLRLDGRAFCRQHKIGPNNHKTHMYKYILSLHTPVSEDGSTIITAKYFLQLDE